MSTTPARVETPKGEPRPSQVHRGDGGRRRPRTRGLALISLIVAGTQSTWGLVIPVLPVYIGALDAGPTALAAVVAAFGLGRLVINIPAGIATAHLNQRLMLVVGIVIVASSTVATGFATSVEMLLAMRFLTGLGGGIVITTGQTILSGTDPDQLGRTMGVLQAFQMAGGALGPAIGGFLVELGAGLPFFVAGGLLAVLALAGAVLPLPRQERPHATQADESADPAPRAPTWTRALVAVSLVGFTVFFVRFGGQQFLFPVLAYDLAGISPAVLGVAITATTVFNLLIARHAGTLTDRWGRRRMVILSTILVGVTTLGFLGSSVPWIFLATLALTGIALALTGPSTGAFLAGAVHPTRRGAAVGIYRTCGDVAILIGPLALGWFLEHDQSFVAILLLALITLLVAGVFWILTRPRRARSTPQRKENR